MQRITTCLILIILGTSSARAAGPADELKALLAELQKEQQAATDAYSKAKTDDERRKIAAGIEKRPAEYAGRFLALARKYPKEPTAFDALALCVVSGAMGAVADQAVDLLLKDHLGNAKIGPFCGEVGSIEAPAAEALLRGVLTRAADDSTRAHACFGMGLLLKKRSEGTQGAEAQKAAAEAERMLVQVVEKYAGVADLAEGARAELFELRHLALGKVAPDIEGTDGAGKKFKLSDYRGRVVVLEFWAGWCNVCLAMVPHQRALVKRLEGQPFALLGVNVDDNREALQKVEAAQQIPWRSWFDGRGGPIGKQWNIRFLPTLFVLDAKGVIRYKGLRDGDLDLAVDKLLRELAAEKKP
jgi:thiol-disulfide isomerase/thioredoxin